MATAILSRRGFERWPPLLVLLFAACAWTLVQWLPMPAGLVEALSPTLQGLRADGADVAGTSPMTSLSMDPPSTLRAFTFFMTLSGIAMIALRLAIHERGRYWLAAGVAITCGLVAIVTGIHQLFGLTSLYGLYTPKQGAPLLMSPLLNTNHLGCLMAVGALTSLGLFAYPKQSSIRRAGWIFSGVACVVVIMATLSRGAVIGFAVGLLVVLFGLLAQRLQSLNDGSRKRRERFFATTLPIAVMITCGLVVAVYLGANTVMQQLEKTSLDEVHAPTSKFAAWKSTVTLIEESPWVGVGRGAFESSFTRVHPASAFATFASPENESIQAIVEWGIPATIILGVLAAWMLLRGLRRWNEGPIAAGAIGAIVAVLFQSNFDFGLELLGVALPVTILLAILTYVPLAEASPTKQLRLRSVRAAHLLAVVAAVPLLWSPLTRIVDEDHGALSDSATHDEILSAVAAHPLDYYGFALLARERLRTSEAEAVRTLNHALRLHPTHAGLHWMAARLLNHTTRKDQAQAEYSTALRYSTDLYPILSELSRTSSVDDAARAIPIELNLDLTVRTLNELDKPALLVRWLERVVTYTSDLRAAELLFTLAMQAKEYNAAELAARRRCETYRSKRCQLELAQVLALRGDHAAVLEALSDVMTWRGRIDDQLPAWYLFCDSYVALKKYSDAKDCIRRLDASGLVKTNEPDVVRRREEIKRLELGSAAPPAPP